MHSFIQSKHSEVTRLCAVHRVSRLELFGSAAGDSFAPDRSDLDFLVEFQTMPPADLSENFFGLKEDLEALFDRPVDLVELAPIRNPYFLAAIAPTRVEVYAA